MCRGLLAVLLLETPGRIVSTQTLLGTLWDSPPRSALSNLRTYRTRLRRDLDRAGLPERILGGQGGYGLRVERSELDLLVFRNWVFRGRRQLRAGEFASAASSLNHAIGLWRGLPGADLPHTGRLSAMLAGLRAELMTATEDKCRAAILSGQHSEAIADLEWHVASYPTHESAWALLACAHYLNGNAAVAQSAVRRAYQMIGSQVGLPPSAALKAAEEAAVRHDDEWFRSYLTR